VFIVALTSFLQKGAGKGVLMARQGRFGGGLGGGELPIEINFFASMKTLQIFHSHQWLSLSLSWHETFHFLHWELTK
jgi:hypothetical protein